MLLARWLDGSIGEEELKRLSASVDLEAFQKRLDAVEKLRPPALDTNRAWDRLNARRTEAKVVPARRRFLFRLSVAASVLLVVAAAWWFLSDATIAVSSGAGEQMAVELPAGSNVQLHPESSLSYDASAWSDKRAVRLKGAAYFEVSKGQAFIVNSPQGVVEVLGTQFDVYAFDEVFEVKCYEGKVRVNHKGRAVVLTANQAIRFEGGASEDWIMPPGQTPDWQSQMSRYKSAKLKQVFADMQRRFGRSISFSQEIGESVYTGGFTHKDLERALRMVCDPMELTFDIQVNKVIIRKK